MEEIVKWYWEHGIKRGNDVNDPDRELRKISIGSWLDPIVKILDRNKDIQSNVSSKACLALWGPSQTGKSTMMSRYVDGLSDDGSDSALTWSDNHKTRFSPPKNGMDSLACEAPDTIVFNPYNHQSDASGVATRYTLQEASAGIVNPEFPIEIKFTTRAQIIQSLSLGYLSECELKKEFFVYMQETFLNEISGETPSTVSPDAYLLLKDIANVIEFMKGDKRFANLFRQGEWDKKIRKALVSSPALLSSTDAAEKFMAKIFWNSENKLTEFYKKAEQMLDELTAEWNGCRILASMEVGSLLLDIDSFKSYVSPKGGKIKQRVSQLAYEKDGDEIHIFLKSGGSKIAGDAFGYFQAICAELKVPLKKEFLEKDPEKNTFIELAEKCDFLDFPGVSNKNVGNNVGDGNAALIDLEKASEAEIFTKVFKQGKTQCFVYNYAKKYGIDAFAILVRTENFPSQSSLLSAGVREWLCSFDPNWTPGRPADMPVFVNMTFFATLINSVALSGLGDGGLLPYVERIQELTFARKESAHFFATTYNQFPGGRIDSPEQQEKTISSIMEDPVFFSSTGLTEENIRAVYSNDGGLDYMFKNMNRQISRSRRLDRCSSILSNDKSELRRLIASQLPSDKDSMTDEKKNKLRGCISSVEEALTKIEEADNAAGYREFAECIKNLFSASYTIFDPVPISAADMSKKEVITYIKAQIAKWYNYKIANLGSHDGDYLSTEQKQAILVALRDSADEQSLFQLIKNNLGHVNNQTMANAARYPFALAFGNLLQTGCMHVENDVSVGDRSPVILNTYLRAAVDKDSERFGSPYYYMILSPLILRLETLAENSRAGARPPQDGDAELKAIFDKIETSKKFQIL